MVLNTTAVRDIVRRVHRPVQKMYRMNAFSHWMAAYVRYSQLAASLSEISEIVRDYDDLVRAAEKEKVESADDMDDRDVEL